MLLKRGVIGYRTKPELGFLFAGQNEQGRALPLGMLQKICRIARHARRHSRGRDNFFRAVGLRIGIGFMQCLQCCRDTSFA